MPRAPIPTHTFVLVIVREGSRFLLVEERKHGGGWFFPAGRVEPGETFEDAALRETLEESGVAIELTGVLRVEHSPLPAFSRLRVLFTARPIGDPTPRTTPNEHTLRAAWWELGEIEKLHLRGPEVAHTLRGVSGGAMIYPLSLLTNE